MSAWTSYAVDLSGLAGETVRLRFAFDSLDAISNDGLGVVIDNLVLGSTCLEKSCSEDAACADDVPGTIGTCAGVTCE